MTSVPVLCVFAAYCAVTLGPMLVRRERAAAAYLTLAVLAGIAVNVDAYSISHVKYSRPDYERALILRREGRTDAALEMFRRAVQENPGDPDPLFQWGATLAGRGDYGGAAILFERAAQAEPGYSKSWFNVGLSMSRTGESASAARAYGRALEVDATYWEAAVGLGDALVELGNYDEAAEAYSGSLPLARNRREAAVSTMSLGRAEAMRGEYEVSLGHFDRALNAFPSSVDARLAKARVLLALGRVEEAVVEARIAARADTADARAKALLEELGVEWDYQEATESSEVR